MPTIIHEIDREEQLCSWMVDLRPRLIAHARHWRRPDPENTVGNVLERVWRRRHAAPSTEPRFRVWVFRIQKNIMIDEWRKENPETVIPGVVDDEGKPKKIRTNVQTRDGSKDVATLPAKCKTLLKAEVAVSMERLSTVLSPDDFTIFWLTEYEGMASAEVGSIVGMRDYKVRLRLVGIRALIERVQWN